MNSINKQLKTRTLSSLAKVFADEYPAYQEIHKVSAMKNETVSFQIAYYCDNAQVVSIKIESPLEKYIHLYSVELVPSEMPVYADHDVNVLRTMPGLFPDLLKPFGGCIKILPRQWRSVWVEVSLDEQAGEDIYPITLRFKNLQGDFIGNAGIELEIIDTVLPDQSLLCTNWLHTDCLSTWYNVPVFSQQYWVIVENYMKTAAEHGMNMIFTPLFTPPLDTEVGGERPTVQLVDVSMENGRYTFGFSKLKRWVDTAQKCEIRYFEMSHLFTQWGAKHAPKIMADTGDGYRRIFSWETDALGPEYTGFLRQFAPALILFLKESGIQDRCLFHISDEPSLEALEQYRNAADLIQELFGEFKIIDALSNYEFYETGAVQIPIPTTDQIEPFIGKVPELWTYYCCGQYKKVANRFFSMPSERNRILGVQLYKFHVAGFLQWGYNFWYSENSLNPIDPFSVTDGGKAWPSGDPFVVYPGENGEPLVSLRLKVFREALQDMRALQLLESLSGEKEVVGLLEEGLDTPITFSAYPKSDEWLFLKREEINHKIRQYSSKIE